MASKFTFAIYVLVVVGVVMVVDVASMNYTECQWVTSLHDATNMTVQGQLRCGQPGATYSFVLLACPADKTASTKAEIRCKIDVCQ